MCDSNPYNTPDIKDLLEKYDLKNPEELSEFYTDVYNRREKQTRICENETVWSGNPLPFIEPSSILYYEEGDKTYCFTKREAGLLLWEKKNPYTGKKLRDSFLEKLEPIWKTPIGNCQSLDAKVNQFILKTGCPYHRSLDPKTAYYNYPSLQPLDRKKIPLFALSKNYDGAVIRIPYLIYEIKLSKPLDELQKERREALRKIKDIRVSSRPQYLSEKYIVSIKLIYNVGSRESEELPLEKYTIKGTRNQEILEDFIQRRGELWYAKTKLSALSSLNIRPRHSVKVYRGFRDNDYKPEKMIRRLGIKSGDKIKLYQTITYKDKYASSWSTNFCISAGFAIHADGNFGLVLEMIVDPTDIIIDTRMIKDFEKIHPSQSEIIVKAGTYKTKVVLLVYGSQRDLKIGWNEEFHGDLMDEDDEDEY
jgi:hypothetical protein